MLFKIPKLLILISSHPTLCLSLCLFQFSFYIIMLLCVLSFALMMFSSVSMSGRHSVMSWRQWSRISWRRGRRLLACWLCSRSLTSWPPACLQCILLHRKEAWQRSTWVSRGVCVSVWLFDPSLAMSLLTMTNTLRARIHDKESSLISVNRIQLSSVPVIFFSFLLARKLQMGPFSL